MVDKSAVGATDDPFTMTIERGKIREFARATMSSASRAIWRTPSR